MKIPLLAVVVAAQFLIAPLHADEVDADAVKQLVEQEIERLLNTEGVLDSAIEQGIARFIRKQQAAAERARTDQQRTHVEQLRPVDLQRDHVFGNPDAAVTLVEYSDFECPFCKRFHPNVIRLMEDNGDKLRWVYRHFPLDIHNPGAQKQAEASECVAELKGNDVFWEYIHAIYGLTNSGGTGFSLENLRPLAEELEVNGDAFDECMASGRMTARVNQDYEDGAKVGISGTPAGFLINRQNEVRFIVGAQPTDELQVLVDELLR